MTTKIVPIPRAKLRLRAGITGFETDQDLVNGEVLQVPTMAAQVLNADPGRLLAMQVRDQGMEPMFFEDDWIVIDTGDTAMRSQEIYAVNWDGEACVAQLLQRGGQWYLNYLNPAFHAINVLSGRLQIVGRVVYQVGRLIAGRL